MANKAKPARVRNYEVSQFVPAAKWVEEERGGPQFNTDDKLSWFLRLYRDELVASGEYIPGRGARASLIGPGFSKLAVKILRRQAAQESL